MGNLEEKTKVFVTCSISGASNSYLTKLENYAKHLESKGFEVYLPHLHTKQDDTEFNICTNNMHAIKNADEVHVYYSSSSKGTHFDLGVSFALGKKIVIVENESYDENEKSFAKMIEEWEGKDVPLEKYYEGNYMLSLNQRIINRFLGLSFDPIINPMFDDDGDPGESTLKQMKDYSFNQFTNLIGLLSDIWHWRDYVKITGISFSNSYQEQKQGRLFLDLKIATGGWSGNELIINYLKRTPFWDVCFEMHERGGIYYFKVPILINK